MRRYVAQHFSEGFPFLNAAKKKKNQMIRNSSLVSFPFSKYWDWWFAPLCWEEEPSSEGPCMSLGENVGNIGLLLFILHVGENSVVQI